MGAEVRMMAGGFFSDASLVLFFQKRRGTKKLFRTHPNSMSKRSLSQSKQRRVIVFSATGAEMT